MKAATSCCFPRAASLSRARWHSARVTTSDPRFLFPDRVLHLPQIRWLRPTVRASGRSLHARDHAIAQLHTLPPRCMPPSAQHKKHPVVDLAQQCAVTAPHRNFCSCHASIGLHQRPRTHQISECASLSLRLSTYPSPVPT